jgi:hypothetical protein
MLKKILAILAAIGGVFSAIFYVLFQQKKDENKAINEKFDDMKNNLDALAEGEKAEKELKQQNEELKEKAHSGNNLDVFNACNELLSK